MAGVMVSVATGVMTSVVEKLTTLLGEEYKLSGDIRRGIRFMRDELSSMNAALRRLADMDDDQIDVQTKEWRSKVRELSYDIEDYIDRFMFLHSSEKAKLNFVQSMVRKIKMLWEDRKIAREIQELKALVVEKKERRDRYDIDQYLTMPQPVLLDPREPAMYDEARDLVGIDGPREEITGWLKSEERQLKVVSIFGIGGQGKTTLAMEVYRKTDETFDCRASVTVSRTLDMEKFIRDILFQINKTEYERSQGWGREQLIHTLKEHLRDKRYLIIIDDIWNVLTWEHVKSALPANNKRSRIITTTRIKEVAQSCCTSVKGHMYEAKPLSEDDSRTLFFRRTFGSSEDCPQQLKEAANDILKKCGGLPLAIISIASLLANESPTVEVWNNVRKSVSSAVEKDSPLDKMKRILFLSYFDLPQHLKSCLLYVSIFPEDYSIDSRDLIWRWAAEGLIPRQNGESTELLGRNCLHELINRSMVQPIKIGADGTTVKICGVHDVILDFIVSRAVEDNFVAILNGNNFHKNSSNKIRRLSIQTGFSKAAEEDKATVVKESSHIRSLHLFQSRLEEMGKQSPQVWDNQALQVLNLEYFNEHVDQIASFSRLKYLRIKHLQHTKLPEQIGNLQHLETLDLRGSYKLEQLPANIVQLQKLVRLLVGSGVVLPDGIGNMQALEELSWVNLDKASTKCIQALGQLIKLRVLGIYNYMDAIGVEKEKACISSLSILVTCRLPCISSLSILVTCRLRSLCFRVASTSFFNSWMAQCGSTTPLMKLGLLKGLIIVPRQIGSLVNLTRLSFEIFDEMDQERLKILASLPKLVSLSVYIYYIFNKDVIRPRLVVGRQGFQRLVKFCFKCNYLLSPLEFEPEAMPKLQTLKLKLHTSCKFKYGHSGVVAGQQYLSGLKHITLVVFFERETAEEVEALEEDIRVAVGSHPNRPTLKVERNEYHMKLIQQSGTVQGSQ